MVTGRLRAQLRRELGENAHEADWILSAVTGMDQNDFVLAPREITPEELRWIGDIVRRRNSGEPLQYILGETEFMGLVFKVTPDTLIPRADTETLVETAVGEIADRAVSVLDIGTGCGCVGISIAKLCKNTAVTLLDYRGEILETAAQNAALNAVSVRCVQCDILKEIPDGAFDVIVSNPPYIAAEVIEGLDSTVKDHEPYTALNGGADGLMFYRRIAAIAAAGLLKADGYIAFEIGYDQGGAVSEILKENGFSEIAVIRDLCDNNRVAAAVRGAGLKNKN